jgi:hypothetical protein
VDAIWEAVLAARQSQPAPSASNVARPAGGAPVQPQAAGPHLNPITLQILSALLAQLAQWLLGKLQSTTSAAAA